MRHIYNHKKFNKFVISREKNLLNLYEDSYQLFVKKLYLSQRILEVKRLQLEKLENRELVNFENYVSHIVYQPNKFRFTEIVEHISFCEFMTMRINQEIKKINKGK